MVTLLLCISGTITDLNLKQVAFQHYNTTCKKYELLEQESKMPQGIWT